MRQENKEQLKQEREQMEARFNQTKQMMIQNTQDQMSTYHQVVRLIWNGAKAQSGAELSQGISV